MSNSNPPGQTPSFLRRIPLAFGAFFSTLADADFAARVLDLRRDGAAVAAKPSQPIQSTQPASPVEVAPDAVQSAAPQPEASQSAVPAMSALRHAPTDAALQLLALLQRDARLIDFTEENLADYADADIGAAARLVHEGCRKVLREHFTIAPVRPEEEESRITLHEGFDAGAIRLTGNVVGKAPFKGTIRHRGWRVSEVRLPKLSDGHDASICAQAEVEL
jgi:hypothetical protein